MALMRLQKYLAECGVASRRKAEDLIRSGRVRVAGKIVTELGTKIDPGVVKVAVDGKDLQAGKKGVLLFHKPRSVVSTRSDPEGRETVFDLLPDNYRHFFTVGRLDFDSSGLIILTNDGELAQALLHPSYEIERRYSVKVRGDVQPETLLRLSRGVKLEDGTARAQVKIIRSSGRYSWAEVVVAEGRNRLVRRLFKALGHPVAELVRLGHGPFKVGRLTAGEFRELSNGEYLALRGRVLKRTSGPAAAKKSPKKMGKVRLCGTEEQ